MDTRELILERLRTILESVDGIDLVLRNDIEVPEDRLPAAILLDGDEGTDEEGFGRGREAHHPVIVRMTPEIYVVTQEDPTRTGPTISAFRAKIIRAIATDPELAKLVHANDIRYMGMQTALSLGRSLQGEAAMLFELAYALYPGQITPSTPQATETES